MTNGEIPPEYVQDPGARGGSGRDPERTPMQWGAGKNAGFTSAVRPWLPLADNFQTHNAETEASDPTSFLSLYRKLGNLRNSSDILKYGRLEVLNSGSSHVLAYKREHKGKAIVTLVNFSNKTVKCKPEIALGELLASSHPEPLYAPGSEHAQLHPHEAVVITAK
jgi:alpha-glucosidase